MENVLKRRMTYQYESVLCKRQLQGTYFQREEITRFLNLLETEPAILEFLNYDKCFRLADNYLIAMVFVYFKRAGLNSSDFTFTNFFSALLLAHALVEENDDFIAEIIEWALPNCSHDQELVNQLEAVKFLMFQAMGLRGYVSRSCCNKVMSTVGHPFWGRQRDSLHGGAARIESADLYQKSSETYDWRTSSCSSCRIARSSLLNPT